MSALLIAANLKMQIRLNTFIDRLPHGFDVFRRLFTVDECRAGDDHISTSSSALVDRAQINAAVGFDVHEFRVGLSEPADLLHHLAHELLSAEARLDGHDENHIDIIDVITEKLHVRLRFDAHADLHVRFSDLAYKIANGLRRRGLDVECVLVDAGPGHVLDPLFGFRDHHVRIEVHVGNVLAQTLDHRVPEGEIRNEVPVHHVQMEIVSAGVEHPTALLGELRQISIENRWTDQSFQLRGQTVHI